MTNMQGAVSRTLKLSSKIGAVLSHATSVDPDQDLNWSLLGQK